MISGLPSLRVRRRPRRRRSPGRRPLAVRLRKRQRYPADLVYPLRTDLIVTKKPPSESRSPRRGRDISTRKSPQVAKLGGETVDPNGVAADQRKLIQRALTRRLARRASQPSAR